MGQDVIRHFTVFLSFPSVVFLKMTDLEMALNVIFCYIMLLICVKLHHHKL